MKTILESINEDIIALIKEKKVTNTNIISTLRMAKNVLESNLKNNTGKSEASILEKELAIKEKQIEEMKKKINKETENRLEIFINNLIVVIDILTAYLRLRYTEE